MLNIFNDISSPLFLTCEKLLSDHVGDCGHGKNLAHGDFRQEYKDIVTILSNKHVVKFHS